MYFSSLTPLMKKRIAVLAILLISASAAAGCISAYRDDVRSDVSAMIPGTLYGTGVADIVPNGEENAVKTAVYSFVAIYGDTEERTYSVKLILSYEEIAQEIIYRLHSPSGTFIPDNVENGNTYTDSLTGDTLTFRNSGPGLGTVEFNGDTAVSFRGSFKEVSFKAVVNYNNSYAYITTTFDQNPEGPKTMQISGTENGTAMTGTVKIITERAFFYEGEVTRAGTVSISIDGTGIPEEYLYFDFGADGDGDLSFMADGIMGNNRAYVVPDLSIVIREDSFSMTGTIDFIDFTGDTMSRSTLEVDYGGSE